MNNNSAITALNNQHSNFQDQSIICIGCQSSFTFTARDQEFYEQKGFQPPRRCKPCRTARKAAREGK